MAFAVEPTGTPGEVRLVCPGCGFNYLRHIRVDVFCRSEDAEVGTHVAVDTVGEKLIVDRNLAGNPSSRRDGLAVEFACEGCAAISRLTIAQHKGQTEIQLDAMTSRSGGAG